MKPPRFQLSKQTPAASHFCICNDRVTAKPVRAEMQTPDLIIVFELKHLLSPLLKQKNKDINTSEGKRQK